MEASKFPLWIAVLGGIAVYSVLLEFELRSPLRRSVESTLTRNVRNLTIAGLSAVAVNIAQTPIAMRLAVLVGEKKWGLLGLVSLPLWAEVVLAVVLLDYTLYVWHVLTHRVPFLWRFHVVHHVDLDMDASTALRFHAAEIVVSIPWRAAQIVVLGVSPPTFLFWQSALLVSTMFHHANLRLPLALERRLAWLVVTPRLHGIHHSCVRDETDSNWSSGLTLWDRLHGTFRFDVPQERITIGVPAYRSPTDVELGRMLALPFGRQRPSWELFDPDACATAAR